MTTALSWESAKYWPGVMFAVDPHGVRLGHTIALDDRAVVIAWHNMDHKEFSTADEARSWVEARVQAGDMP